MSRNQYVVRFAVGDPDGPQSPIWLLWTSRNTSDVFLAASIIADQAKVTFHESGRWRKAFTEKYAGGPNPYVKPGEDRATLSGAPSRSRPRHYQGILHNGSYFGTYVA